MSMQRREFLKLSAMAGGGIIVSGSMPAALARDVAGSAAAATTTDPVALSYFLEVHSDDRIRFLSIKHEMGQGVATSLAMILAEELGVDFRQVTVEFPSTGQARYALSGTGGSTTVKDMYLPIRKAAAWLLVPYMAWLCFAAILNFQIDQRNPDAETLAPAAASTQIG